MSAHTWESPNLSKPAARKKNLACYHVKIRVKSLFLFPIEVTTDFGKSKIIHKAMHCVVIQKFFLI